MVCTALAAFPLFAAEIVKQNNTEPLNAGTSWVGGTAPGAADVAVWNNTVTGANDSPLNAAATWDGIRIANPGGPVTVSGSVTLTLDGGAATDINLSAATQDLTLAAPLIIGNAEQVMNVAAGRALTFAGPVTVQRNGNWSRTGTGTVLFDGPVASATTTTLELQSGTNVFTGKNGGFAFTSTASGARLYLGRYTGNRATLIISNGFHEARGVHDESNANFVGVGSGSQSVTGRLVIEGGTLRVPYLRAGINSMGDGGITVNGGALEITHGSATAERAGYGLMLANHHQDIDSAIADTHGFLTVNAGQVSVTNGIISLGSKNAGSTGSAAVTLNGGELAMKRFYVLASPLVPKTVTFNGGTLRLTGDGRLFDGPGATNGSLALLTGAGGARIDTGASNLSLDAPLAGPGGLDKLGGGTLTLAAANTYAGRTRVYAGMLRFTGTAAAATPDLAVASGARLSLADGALAAFSPAAVAFGTAAPVTLELETAADGPGSDRLALPAGATLGAVVFAPVTQGTSARSARPGDYVVLSYGGSAPDIGRFTVPDPAPFRSYTFILDEQAKTVALRIAHAGSVSEWIAPGSGDWETAGNWTAAPASAAGAAVRLGAAIHAPATVTANAPVTLGRLEIDNANAYTLAGGGFTFDNGLSASRLTATNGQHTVSAPLTLTGELAAVSASGASLTLAGVIGGSGALVKDGAGDVILSQPNAYSGGTVVKQNALVLSGNATPGSGAVMVDGGSGFRFLGPGTAVWGNDVVIATSAAFNTLGGSASLTGDIDWQLSDRALVKSGGYELALSGTGSETDYARFQIDSGTLRLKEGADFRLMNTSGRDTVYMKANNAGIRALAIEEGAQLTAAGIDMEYGSENNVTVDGGALRLLGGGQYNDALSMRGQGAGTDRFTVTAGTVTVDDGKWVGVGYRTGLAYLTVDGGTTSLSRVSLGARENDNADLHARGFVEVNGGLLEVRGQFNWMGSGAPARTNTVTLNGGVWRTVATANPRYGLASVPILRFNGGTLETLGKAAYGASDVNDYLYGVKAVYVDAGGARVDTRGLDVTFTQPLLKGEPTDGGLTKLGAGRLALAGACAFTGPTAVEQGTLTLPAVYASGDVTVAAGATLSLVNGAAQTFSPGSASFAAGAVLALEAGDVVALPAGASVDDIALKVVKSGTDEPVAQAGDTTLFTFPDVAPSVAGWTLLNPAPGRDVSLVAVGQSVVLRVAYAPGVSIWTAPGSGDWDTAGNWTTPPGTDVRFDDAIAAPATVTLGTAATVGALAFNNAHPYTLAGAGLTLGDGGTLAAERGLHSVNVPLALGGGARFTAGAGAGLALNGGVSGAAPPTVAGPGEIALPAPDALGLPGLTLEGAVTVVVSNSAAWAVPVTLGEGGGVFAPAADTALDVTAAVTGNGGLTKRASSFLTLTNANAAYAGGTRVEAGTLRLDTLPEGGIVFGQGTLHYTGSGALSADGYTLDTGDDTRAGVLRADGDITFQGNVTALSGTLVKTGPGTVSFTAPGLNVFNAGNGAGTSHNVLDIGPYGDTPTTGFSGFNVVDGKVVIGAAGQTNRFNGLLVVGLNSTADADGETAGGLEVSGGVTTVSDALIVGRSNGTTNTAAIPRVSRLRMTGGELWTPTLVLGRVYTAAGHRSAPEAELAGGALTATNAVIVGEQTGVSATLKLSGGTLVAPNIVRLNGEGRLVFDGGVFRPSADAQTLQSLTAVRVDAGGAVFDLSLAGSYFLGQTLTGEGGLAKTGAGGLAIRAKQAYSGATAVAEGRLRLHAAGGVSNVTAITVAPGAELALDDTSVRTVELAALTLGAAAPAAPAALTLGFKEDGSTNDLLAVNGPVVLGGVDVTLATAGRTEAFAKNGTYTFVTYTGSDPEVSGLRVANPLYGKAYTFAAAAGRVTLTVGADDAGGTGGAAVWKSAGGGDWETASNWTVPPANAAGAAARLDDSVTAPATVAVNAPATLGELYFNSTNGYTLAGAQPLTLAGGAGAPAAVNVEAGAHTLALPVAVTEAGLGVNAAADAELVFSGGTSGGGPLVKAGGGDLTFAAPGARTGTTELTQGALALRDGGTPGTGEIVLNGGPGMRVTGSAPATLANKVTFAKTARLNARDQAVTLTGTLDIMSGQTLQKYGTNRLVLAGAGGAAGNGILQLAEGPAAFAAGANYVFSGATRDAVTLGSTTNLRTSLTIEPGASVTAGGLSANAEASGTPGGDAVITQNGGAVSLTYGDALFVRLNGTAPATYVMNGGTLSMPPASWANVGLSGPGTIEVNGGTMTLGRFAAGYQTRTNAVGKGSARVTVNGGRLAAAGAWSWMSDGNARATEVTLNGGTLALPATSIYGTNVANWTALTLDGGTLEFTGPALDSAATDDVLRGARRVAVGPRGGTLYPAGGDVTVRQNVEGLAATGTLVKVGGSAVTLAGTNTLAALDVREGTLRARLERGDLPGVPLFHYRFDSANPLADSSGHGFTLRTIGGTPASQDGHAGEAFSSAGGSSGGFYQLPDSALWGNVTQFTFSAWLYLPAAVSGSDNSLLSARTSGASDGRALEIKLLAYNGNQVRVLNTSAGGVWWNEVFSEKSGGIPLNQWTHVAVTHSQAGCRIYIDGEPVPMRMCTTSSGISNPYDGNGWYYPDADLRLSPYGALTGLTIGKTTSSTSGTRLRGGLDDLIVYDRILTDAEIAQLHAGTPSKAAALHVADMGIYDLEGRTQAVSAASGSGAVVNGTLAVGESLAGSLAVQNLALGAGVVVRAGFEGPVTAVSGTLTVDGAGAVDFGRTEAEPVTHSFAAVVMTYGSVAGAGNLAGWAVTGLGREGYQATVTAEGGEVVVRVKATFGTAVILK
jgi:autotransporter-associated beta strand protein